MNKDKNRKLSYESDGEMGIEKKEEGEKSQKENEQTFFNTTQNSE